MSKQELSRREFLKLAGISGAIIATGGGLGSILSSCEDVKIPELTVAELKKAEPNIGIRPLKVTLHDVVIETIAIEPDNYDKSDTSYNSYKIYDKNSPESFYYGINFKSDWNLGYDLNPVLPGNKQTGRLVGKLYDEKDNQNIADLLGASGSYINILGFKKDKS
jgi:hypothetical protein